MIPTSTKLGLVLAGNRLVATAIRRQRAQAFVIEGEQPSVALRAELDARKLAPRTVAIGLPRTSVTVKPIEFPVVTGELREMIRFELERHLPIAADDAAFDFALLGGGAGAAGAARRVLVAAADRRVVEAALRMADEAKLRATSVTVAAHDLLALVTLDRKRQLVWGHRHPLGTDLLFVANSQLVMSRFVSGVTDAEIAAEIQQSLAVLRWRTVDAVWLSGETEYAAADFAPLGAPVSAPPYTPVARRLLAGLADDGATPRGLSELALAVAIRRGARSLDLIPAARRPRRVTRAQWVTAAMLAATVGLGVATLLYPGFRAARHLASVNRKIEALTPEVRAVERVQQDLERKRKLLATIVSLESSSARPLPVLRELTEVIPNEAWLTSLAFDTKGVELTGQAAAASTLIPLLENSPRLERVEFSSPVTRGRDKEQFRIKASWEAPARTAATPPPQAAAPPATPPPARPPGTAAAAPSPPGGSRAPEVAR